MGKTSPSRIDLKRIIQCRSRIEQQETLLGLLDDRLDGAYFEECVLGFVDALPKGLSRRAIRSSLFPLLGEIFTYEKLREYAWRLAGNIPRLKAGLVVLAWVSQASKEWVPVQFIDGRPAVDAKGRRGYFYRVRILAGSPALMRIWRFLPKATLLYFAPQFGFSRFGPGVLTNLTEIVGLQCVVELDPKYSRGRPGFFNMSVPASMRARNRNLLRQRLHLPDVFPCPNGYVYPCFDCHVGYRDCPCGVHPRNFEVGDCAECGKRGWFDPARVEPFCVSCALQKPFHVRVNDVNLR